MRRQEAVLKARLQDAQKREEQQDSEIAQALHKNVIMEALLKKVLIFHPHPKHIRDLKVISLFANRSYEVQLLR